MFDSNGPEIKFLPQRTQMQQDETSGLYHTFVFFGSSIPGIALTGEIAIRIRFNNPFEKITAGVVGAGFVATGRLRREIDSDKKGYLFETNVLHANNFIRVQVVSKDKPEIVDLYLQPTSEIQPRVGIITALPKEFVAMKAMLENVRQVDIPARRGKQRYFGGEVSISSSEHHTVVLSLMPDMGNNAASVVASRLLNHFPSVNDLIMVGIAGGIPNVGNSYDHVRLGDVVVSDRNGVVQYDFIKEEIQEIAHRHPPRPPSARLLEAVRYMEADELEGKRPWLKHTKRADHIFNAGRPAEEKDRLRDFAYPTVPESIEHPHDQRRRVGEPRVFLGTIASANTLLKNPTKRDALRDKFGVKAVEMEGSGIADATWSESSGYLVVRGICDYCDSDKTDDWQEYAAIVAAAYTRGLLETMPV